MIYRQNLKPVDSIAHHQREEAKNHIITKNRVGDQKARRHHESNKGGSEEPQQFVLRRRGGALNFKRAFEWEPTATRRSVFRPRLDIP